MARAWLSGITAALLLVLIPMAPARAACALTRYASVDLMAGPNGAVLVPVRIADQDVWMVLQMSSGLAMISPAAVRQLELPTGWVRTDVRMMARAFVAQLTAGEREPVPAGALDCPV